jgi:hypothetical protein
MSMFVQLIGEMERMIIVLFDDQTSLSCDGAWVCSGSM